MPSMNQWEGQEKPTVKTNKERCTEMLKKSWKPLREEETRKVKPSKNI